MQIENLNGMPKNRGGRKNRMVPGVGLAPYAVVLSLKRIQIVVQSRLSLSQSLHICAPGRKGLREKHCGQMGFWVGGLHPHRPQDGHCCPEQAGHQSTLRSSLHHSQYCFRVFQTGSTSFRIEIPPSLACEDKTATARRSSTLAVLQNICSAPPKPYLNNSRPVVELLRSARSSGPPVLTVLPRGHDVHQLAATNDTSPWRRTKATAVLRLEWLAARTASASQLAWDVLCNWSTCLGVTGSFSMMSSNRWAGTSTSPANRWQATSSTAAGSPVGPAIRSRSSSRLAPIVLKM